MKTGIHFIIKYFKFNKEILKKNKQKSVFQKLYDSSSVWCPFKGHFMCR